MLERTGAITIEVLEPITFVPAYRTVYRRMVIYRRQKEAGCLCYWRVCAATTWLFTFVSNYCANVGNNIV